MSNNSTVVPPQILPPTTAGICPDQFNDDHFFGQDRKVALIALICFLVLGFALRTYNLGAESLGEDELNKLQTVQEYRTNGLSGKNGEHPFLMKGLETVSVITAEKLNQVILSPQMQISVEAALRFPNALFGTFTILLLFLLVSQLFGRNIGLIAAAFYAIEPMAISFDRIAKEDSLMLFFFLLMGVFWLSSQTAAERGKDNWTWYAWAAAASFGALMASKYLPHLLAVPASYYVIFLEIPAARWRLGKLRWLKFIIVMGLAFVVLNPTILMPDTWREMLKFGTENRIGHDSYEFMGGLYRNQMSAWFAGVPWTFYYVFIAVKSSLPTLIFFLIGLPIMFRRRLGDGRFYIFFWAFMWFMPFTVLGGKFTRYFTVAAPLVFIVAAVGFYFTVRWLTVILFGRSRAAVYCQALLFIVVVSGTVLVAAYASPHFRLFTNLLGGASSGAGAIFPHDEFYDMSTREIIGEIAAIAPPGTVIASETPTLFEYYAGLVGRSDLIFISLSDNQKVGELRSGDLIVIVRGRRYLSNTAYQEYLEGSVTPVAEVWAKYITTARIYQMDQANLAEVLYLAK